MVRVKRHKIPLISVLIMLFAVLSISHWAPKYREKGKIVLKLAAKTANFLVR